MALDPTKNPNHEFLKRLGDKKPIIIRLSPGQKAKVTVKGPPNIGKDGLRRTHRRKKYRNWMKSKGLILFDLGQIKDGELWKDLPWSRNPGLTVDVHPVSNDAAFHYEDMTQADTTAMADLVHEIPVEDWKDHYRRIDSDLFGLTIYQGEGSSVDPMATYQSNPRNRLASTNPDWNVSKAQYKPIDNPIEIVAWGGLSYRLDTYNASLYKYTEGYDYALPDLGPSSIDTKKGKTEVYLMPRPIFIGVRQDTGMEEDRRLSLLIGHWTIVSRELWFDKTINRVFHDEAEVPVLAGYPFAGFGLKSNGAYMYSFDYVGDAFLTEIFDWIKSRSETQLFVQRGESFDGGTYAFEPLSNFPFDSVGDQEINGAHYIAQGESFPLVDGLGGQTMGSEYLGEGILLAVVANQGRYIYVWSKGDISGVFAGYPGLEAESTPDETGL